MATLETGGAFVIQMKEYSREACTQAAEACAKGKAVRQIQYFEKPTALMMPSLQSSEPGPDFCVYTPSVSGSSSPNVTIGPFGGRLPRPQPPNPGTVEKTEAFSARVENYLFGENENKIGDLSGMHFGIHYKVIGNEVVGYNGNVNNIRIFDRVFFKSDATRFFSGPLSFSSYPIHNDAIDVFAIFYDRNESRDEWSESAVLQKIDLATAPNIKWKNDEIFEKKCKITHIYIDGILRKTISWIDISSAGTISFTGDPSVNSLIPAACLAVGLLSHVGVRNLESLNPEAIIEIGTGHPDWRFIRDDIMSAARVISQYNVKTGMSRIEVRQQIMEKWAAMMKVYQNSLESEKGSEQN